MAVLLQHFGDRESSSPPYGSVIELGYVTTTSCDCNAGFTTCGVRVKNDDSPWIGRRGNVNWNDDYDRFEKLEGLLARPTQHDDRGPLVRSRCALLSDWRIGARPAADPR